MPSAREPAFVADPPGLVDVGHGVVGIDALGEVPQLLAAATPGGGHLAALDHLDEQPLHVLVVVPARGPPGHLAGVRELAGRQRAVAAQQLEDVAPALVVGLDPLRDVVLPVLHLVRPPGPDRHLGAERRQVLAGPDHPVVVDQPLLVECVAQVTRVVRRPEPAPEQQVRTRGDRGDRVVLDQRQPVHDLEQVGGPRRVQQLRAHRDPPRLLHGQPVHQASTPSGSPCGSSVPPSHDAIGSGAVAPSPSSSMKSGSRGSSAPSSCSWAPHTLTTTGAGRPG